MKRSELPYLAVVAPPDARDHYLIGGSARATVVRSRVESAVDICDGAEKPHLVIRIPLADFERVDWSTLEAITETEQAACPA